PWGLRRFEWRSDKLFQRSMSEENKEWEIVQTIDTITPGNVHFSEKSLRAKLMNKDGAVSSQLPSDDASLAHANSSMTCYACHTSWTPTCFGCHLQMTANARKPMLHNEGLLTKNDNNAWMAQLLLEGTNFMNFMGRYVYVATGKKGFEAIAVAEHDEPEAIYGSDLQRIAYPDNYKNFLNHHRQLNAAAEHPGN